MTRLQEVVTHPQHRRRGLATRVVREVLSAEAQSRGPAGRHVIASVDVEYHAMGLYEKLGFHAVGADEWSLLQIP